MTTPRVLAWVPLPPPYAGPEVASALLVDALRAELGDLHVESASLRAENMDKGRLDWDGVRAFARAYARFVRGARAADVVYMVAAANPVGALRDAVLIRTARALGRRVVLHLRGGRYGEFYAESSPPLRRVLRASWGSAACAIVQTPRLRAALADAAPHVRTEVVPNGLPAARYPAKTRYATDAPRLLFVGHLTHFKGFHDLMRAFRIVRARHPRATLVCAGELPQPARNFAAFLPAERRADYLRRRALLCDEIRAFVAAGAREGVAYLGVVDGDAKTAAFTGADVLVLPSYTEGFSLAILEAMFHGLPVIASAVGGTPDLVREGEGGLLVAPGDVDGLARALDALLCDPSRREAMGRRNAAEARARYDLPVVAHILAAVLRAP